MTVAGGAPAAVPRQRLALLVLLAAAGDAGVSRDRLLATLWPERPDDVARHSLGQLLYALRRDLRAAAPAAGAPDPVVGTTTLRLDPDVVAYDGWAFERALRDGDPERAAALYGGPFLHGVHLRGPAELERWVDGERARLATLHRDALESLARGATARGDAADAGRWWRRLAAADPLDARATVGLMRALADAGDRAAALQAARVHEALVRQELECEPDPAVTALAEELRTVPASPPARGGRRAGQETAETTDGADPPRSAATIPAPEPAREGRNDRGTDPSFQTFPPAPAPPRGVPAAPAGPVRGGRPAYARPRRWLAVTGTAAALVGAAIAVAAARRGPDVPPLDPKRIYVAPLENRTGDPSLDPLGAMAADWVAQGLEQSGRVRVASAPREPRDGRDAAAPAARAERLGAGTLVSGAFYRQGDSLHFRAQVSDVRRGEVLAALAPVAGAADDPLAPIEGLRRRAVAALAALLDPRLESWVRVATKPPSYEAYREFITGQSIWASDYARARTHFERAAALDSTFYAAHVEVAILHRLLGDCARTDSVAARLAPVRDRLAPYDYHQLDVQVAQCRGDWETAYREARALAELRPGSPFLDYAYALQALGVNRYAEARAALARHDPERATVEVGANYLVVLAATRLSLDDADGALATARLARRLRPDRANTWGMEAVVLARLGRVADAEAVLDSMTAHPLRPQAQVAQFARVAAGALDEGGHADAARRARARVLAWLAALPAEERARPWHRAEVAHTLYAAGRWDEARAAYERLAAEDPADVEHRGALGALAARRGDLREAERVDAWLAAVRDPYAVRRTYQRARIAALLGRREAALALLRRGLDEMGYFGIATVRAHPDLASLRGDPRFAEITRAR